MKSLTKTNKKKAWDIFSKWVRLSNSKDGENVECYTCGKIKPIKQMSAGHGIGGRNGAVLFLEEIVKPQCAGCNIWGRGQYQIFTRKLIDELGLQRYDELVTWSRQTLKYTAQDYLDVYEKYKRKVSDL